MQGFDRALAALWGGWYLTAGLAIALFLWQILTVLWHVNSPGELPETDTPMVFKERSNGWQPETVWDELWPEVGDGITG